MKRYLLLIAVIFGFSLYINAENLTINGTVELSDGTPQSSYEVLITSADSAFGFYYTNLLLTNEDGIFTDQIELPGDLSQGAVTLSVMSCNEMLTITEYFYPSNYDLDFSFIICADSSGGGGNDTVAECENFFYYDVEGLNASFFGMVYPEYDNTTYAWSFGDGTSGSGMEVTHEYPSEGDFEVVLTTTSGDDCTAISYQVILIYDDGTGGGNDTTWNDCENYFYYYIDDLTANFYGMVSSNDDATFSWEFGDGSFGEGMEVSHSYSEEGSYEVLLTTTTGDTCTATSYQLVVIGDDSSGWNDCINWFGYQINNFSVEFEGWAIGNDENADFYWDFDDGTTGEGASVMHDFEEEGYYTVTLTTVSGNNCTATSTQVVHIGETSGGQDVYGQVYINNAGLDYGVAILFSTDENTGEEPCYMFRETIIDSMGSFSFHNVPNGEYYMIAFPDYTSAYFETHLPTYYGDVIFWEDATVIELGDANNPYIINLVSAAGANAGEGLINGDIVSDDFKSQLEGEQISLFLIDDNNQPLEITYSEANSSFDFSNIAFGTYVVYAEITGIPTIPAVVTLTAENPSADITIEVSPNGVSTGVHDVISSTIDYVGNIYPNPVMNKASIEISLKKQTTINISIYNQIGQLVQSKIVNAGEGVSVIQIQTDGLPNGVYNMQLVSDDGASFNQKFIK